MAPAEPDRDRRRRRWRRRVAWTLLLGFVALNAVAWLQVGSMLHWSSASERTSRPENLGLLEKARILVTGVSIPRPENHMTPRDLGLDFEVVTLDNGLGGRLEAWSVPAPGGEGGADVEALLFHGYASSKDSMLSVARGLFDLGCGVLLVDFHGSGGSSGSGTTIGIREARDVVAALSWGRARWPQRRLVTYGVSMGGAAILRAVAALGARPDGIVVESTFDRLLSTVEDRFHRMGLPAFPGAHVLLLWGSVRLGVNAFAHDPARYAASVTCPTLVLQGALDPNVGMDGARTIHARLAGWKQVSEYVRTGHQDIRTTDRERWRQDVATLLGAVRDDAR